VRAIMGKKGHVVPRFHAAPDQFRCEHACQPVDFLEGELLPAELDKCFSGTQGGTFCQDMIKRKDFSYHAGQYIIVGGTIKAEKCMDRRHYCTVSYRTQAALYHIQLSSPSQ